MRLVEGKKNENLQVKIQQLEKEIGKKIKQYHELNKEINKLKNEWYHYTNSERIINNEEWMLSDQLKLDMMEYNLLPAWLRGDKE